jgi:hypothetical protein
MTQPSRKRQICSYDLSEVSTEIYVLVEEQGEMCFLQCTLPLSLAVQYRTNPYYPDQQKKSRSRCPLHQQSAWIH